MKQRNKTNERMSSQRGFTLIELMIAMLIAVIVIGGAFAIFKTQSESAVYIEEKNEMNASINATFNLMFNEIRLSGYSLPSHTAINPINNFKAVGGFLASSLDGGTAFAADVQTGTDAVMVLTKDNDCKLANYVDNSAPFTNASGTNARVCQNNCFNAATGAYKVGDVALILGDTGGNLKGFFVEFTSITLNSGPAGGICGGTPYTLVNWTGLDEYNLAVRSTAALSDQGVFRLSSHYIYYVNTQSQLARWRISAVPGSEVIGDGVEDMQMQYDLDLPGSAATGCSQPQPANSWCSACALCNGPATYPNATQMAEIRGIHFSFVLRNPHEDRVAFLNKGSKMNLDDHTWGAITPDSYRRTTVGQLIRVKNLELQDY